MNQEEFLQIDDWVDKHDEFVNKEGNEKSEYMISTRLLIQFLKTLIKEGPAHG